ncbi:MAG: hypothetical protein NTW21_23410 [Verrucomicrobia bacterium]|nr:hypothetical protein [Verrucomicrobiota bacterium]
MKIPSPIKNTGATITACALALAVWVGVAAGSVQATTATSTRNLGPPDGGTTITGGGSLEWIAQGDLPPGSILRSVSIDARLDAMAPGSDSWAADLNVYVDGLLRIGTNGNNWPAAIAAMDWNGSGIGGVGTAVICERSVAGGDFPDTVDLNSATLSLVNAYDTATWSGTVTVIYDTPGPALIVSFGLRGNPAVIDQAAKTITWNVPFGTDLETLAPTYRLSSGTCSPESGVAPDFATTSPVTYTVTDGAVVNGYTVTVTVLPAPSDYDIWADGFGAGFSDRAPTHDPDHDGMTNQQEYAFGLDPTLGSSVNPIIVPLDKTTGRFSYTRRDPPGLAYTVWTSTDLVAWTEDVGALQTPGASMAGVQTVAVILSGMPLTAPTLWVRVQAK